MESQEVFKNIKGYRGEYQISNLGRVKSFKMKRERFLKPRLNCCNYYHVSLCKNGNVVNANIHRLIGLYFIPNPLHKAEVNHIDGDRTNYNISNLEWLSHAENIKHGKDLKGTKSKFTEQDLISIRYICQSKFCTLREIAEIFCCSITAIHIIAKNKKWSTNN